MPTFDVKITSIDTLGLIAFQFSENVNFNRSLQYMNSTYINVTLQISDPETCLEPKFKPEFLDFTWNITSYENTTMQMKLNFTNPHYISMKSIYDRINIEFD